MSGKLDLQPSSDLCTNDLVSKADFDGWLGLEEQKLNSLRTGFEPARPKASDIMSVHSSLTR